VRPQIPLGCAGQLKGKRWTTIGFQVRSITVEGITYEWREYVLWNPEGGFRYLTEYDGHWNDVTTVKGLPREVVADSKLTVDYLGTRFKHFQNAQATTRFVLGEFPWEARVGDKVWNDDFVAPPLMLSRESSPNEITWSLGTYTPPRLISEAFKLEKPLPAPRGVYANQPNPSTGAGLGRMFAAFAAALLLLFIWRQATARDERVFGGGFRFDPRAGDTAAFVTKVFELKGHASNVSLRFDTDLDNDNAFFNVALIPESGGSGFEIGRNVSYYYGVDGGEAWSEGSPSDQVILPSVAPGRYYLRVEPEHDGLKPVIYTINAKRDVPRIWPFLVALGVLGAAPLLSLSMRAAFEKKRWAESDYAPEEDE
jgi:hypothetical protein